MFIPQIPERKQLSVPKIESPEGYYEEAEPYDTSLNGTPRGQGWDSEGVQSLPAQMPGLEAAGSLGCCSQRAWPELRTEHRALGLCSGGELRAPSRPRPPARRRGMVHGELVSCV